MIADRRDTSPIFEIKSKKLICTSCKRAGADPREREREREGEEKGKRKRPEKWNIHSRKDATPRGNSRPASRREVTASNPRCMRRGRSRGRISARSLYKICP